MSKRVNKSERTIYRVIKGMPSDFVKDNVKVCVNDNGKRVKLLTSDAYKYILQHFDIECQNPSQSDKMCQNSTNDVTFYAEKVTKDAEGVTERAEGVTFSNNVEFLLQQLVEKDKQIEYLQQHIQELTELNKNQQVLLQNQQVLFLPEKKKSLFNFFSRRK